MDKPGRLRWKTPITNVVSLHPTADVLVTDLLHHVAGHDAHTGAPLFRRHFESWSGHRLTMGDGEFLVVHQTGLDQAVLECCDGRTGAARWVRPVRGRAHTAAFNGRASLALVDGTTLRVLHVPVDGAPLDEEAVLGLPDTPGGFQRAFLADGLVGVGSATRSLVWRLADRALLWDAPHPLECVLPWGWWVRRSQSYAVELFNALGQAEGTFRDPSCDANNAELHAINGRGYQVVAANQRHVALTSASFSRTSGYGTRGLFLLPRGAGAPVAVEERAHPCVHLGDEVILVGRYGGVRALEDSYTPRWETNDQDWEGWGLKVSIVSHLRPQADALFAATFEELFCLSAA